MANEIASGVASAATPEVKKVSRRGIGSARGTTRLKFTHELAKPNGLFIAHLDSVTTSMISIGDDKTGMPSFNGLEIPKIVFTFASNEDDTNKRHYVTLQFTAVESNANTIPGAKDEWKVNTVFDWIKHILNVFVLKGRELTAEEEESLSLNFEDFDESGEYVPVEAETVIAAWKTLFENVEAILNRGNDGKPYYKSAKDNKPIALWIKLLRYFKTRNKSWTAVNGGDLAFPGFVGEGCIEVYKQNLPASIRVDMVKEAIIPMNIEKPKTPNMPTPMAGGFGSAMGSAPVIDTMGTGTDFSNVAAAAGEDMPF